MYKRIRRWNCLRHCRNIFIHPTCNPERQHILARLGKNHIPMIATWPGRLSVGTRVWEMPKAPRVSAMDLRYGATTFGASGMVGNASSVKRRSALSPSPVGQRQIWKIKSCKDQNTHRQWVQASSTLHNQRYDFACHEQPGWWNNSQIWFLCRQSGTQVPILEVRGHSNVFWALSWVDVFL